MDLIKTRVDGQIMKVNFHAKGVSSRRPPTAKIDPHRPIPPVAAEPARHYSVGCLRGAIRTRRLFLTSDRA
jgi:hypothetical protein